MEQIKSNIPMKGVVVSHIGGRSENQDSYGFSAIPIGFVVVVCDGMGGLRGGRMASTIAVNTIIQCLLSEPKESDPAEVLFNAIKQANVDIMRAGQENPEYAGMGTTVTAVIISKEAATVAHVGDSRIYQLRGREKVFRTFDHSMVFEMVKSGVITEEQARLSDQSNVILKALGVYPEVEPDIEVLPYAKGDRFVLCSDGFWGVMPEKEFLQKMTRRKELGTVVKEMVGEVESIGQSKGGNHDNLTAAVIEMNSNSLKKVKMTKKVKIILAVLAALLVASLTLNIIYISKYVKASKAGIEKVEKEVKEEGAKEEGAKENSEQQTPADEKGNATEEQKDEAATK